MDASGGERSSGENIQLAAEHALEQYKAFTELEYLTGSDKQTDDYSSIRRLLPLPPGTHLNA